MKNVPLADRWDPPKPFPLPRAVVLSPAAQAEKRRNQLNLLLALGLTLHVYSCALRVGDAFNRRIVANAEDDAMRVVRRESLNLIESARSARVPAAVPALHEFATPEMKLVPMPTEWFSETFVVCEVFRSGMGTDLSEPPVADDCYYPGGSTRFLSAFDKTLERWHAEWLAAGDDLVPR